MARLIRSVRFRGSAERVRTVALIEISDVVGVALLAGIAATLGLWVIRRGRMP
ncbi:MAG: hypothetical protein ACRYGP_07090 [Janthinobacterium lividum]